MLQWFKKLLGIGHAKEAVKADEMPRHFHVDRQVTKKTELPDFSKYTKKEIDVWAKKNHKIDLDRRKTKINMINELKTKLKSKES